MRRACESVSNRQAFLRVLLGLFWAVLGPSWADLGPSWAVLGSFPPWGPLGALSGPSWGPPVALLGLSWEGFGTLWGPSWAVLRLSWAVVGASRETLGGSLGRFGRAHRPGGSPATPQECPEALWNSGKFVVRACTNIQSF